MVFNEKVSEREYRRIRGETLDGKYSTLRRNIEKFDEVHGKTIWKNLSQVNCEDCVGDSLVRCSRCYQCYASFNAQDVRYAWDLTPSEKCVSAMDLTQGGIGELLYNSQGLGGGNYFMRMCIRCRLSSHQTYCIDCYSCKDCFGCTGLRNKQYCVLNKQLRKEEYEELVPRIVAHMRSTNEWGEFFPLTVTTCAYNLSNAQKYFPLTREEVRKRGWRWEDLKEEIPMVNQTIPATQLPDSIDDIPDDIVNWAITCEKSNRPFRIVRKELQFYRMMRLPLPRVHPDLRMLHRWQSCNPFRLWTRSCTKCGREMQTSFAPDRTEIVYCENCYLKEVY
jgi:CxxC-x17-CxxC domain-containing protein